MRSRIIRPSDEQPEKIAIFKFGPLHSGDHAQHQALTTGPSEEHNAKVLPGNHVALPGASTVEEQCELLILQARAKVSEIEKEAYEQGFAEGQRAGAEVGEKMVDALLKQYSVSVEELNKLRKEIFSSSEREVIRLALEVAKKIVKREVAIDEELILTLVKVALN